MLLLLLHMKTSPPSPLPRISCFNTKTLKYCFVVCRHTRPATGGGRSIKTVNEFQIIYFVLFPIHTRLSLPYNTLGT